MWRMKLVKAIVRPNKVDEIKDALAGNFCRCTGYAKIFESVEAAAQNMKGGQR